MRKGIENLLDVRDNCKFEELCKMFSTQNFTCTHKGGEYCGKYRTLNREITPELVLA
jgi:hypothetical protein